MHINFLHSFAWLWSWEFCDTNIQISNELYTFHVVFSLRQEFTRRGSDCLSQYAALRPFSCHDGTLNLWIVKPGARSCGRGIQVMNRLENILTRTQPGLGKESRFVVQKYIGTWPRPSCGYCAYCCPSYRAADAHLQHEVRHSSVVPGHKCSAAYHLDVQVYYISQDFRKYKYFVRVRLQWFLVF